MTFSMPPGLAINKLLNFLSSQGYKDINVNYSLLEVSASKRKTLLKKDYYFFKIIPADAEIITLQINLNSERENKNEKEIKNELKICEKIQSYF